MLDATQSLRGRLTVTYTIALALGLFVFAAFGLAAIEHALSSALDARLATTARLLIATLNVRNDRLSIDALKQRRLLSVLGVQQNGAVLDGRGSVVVLSAALPSAVRQVAHVAAPGQLQYRTVNDSNGRVRVAAQSIRIRGHLAATVLLWRSIDFISDYERSAIDVFAVAFVAIVGAATFIGGAIARRGLRPLTYLAAVASEIEAHDLSRRLGHVPRNDELGQLCTTFDRMLDRLEAAFEQQRQFTADASHELRAPLAVIRAELELALRRDREAAEDQSMLLSLGVELQELERLVEELLIFARFESESLTLTAIHLSSVITDAVARMNIFASTRSVRITDTTPGNLLVRGNYEALERIVVSLLHNAIKFAREGGSVVLWAKAERGVATIGVRDDGPGFSDEALVHACDRFWRGDMARGRSGSGLGLAIAKRAIAQCGGTIALSNGPLGGAEVTLELTTVTLPAPTGSNLQVDSGRFP